MAAKTLVGIYCGTAAKPETNMQNHEVVDILNTLIETSRDGDNGFTACAEDSKDASLRAYFTVCATRCRESVRTLEEVVKSYGGTPEPLGSVMGSLIARGSTCVLPQAATATWRCLKNANALRMPPYALSNARLSRTCL